MLVQTLKKLMIKSFSYLEQYGFIFDIFEQLIS